MKIADAVELVFLVRGNIDLRRTPRRPLYSRTYFNQLEHQHNRYDSRMFLSRIEVVSPAFRITT